MSTLPARRPPSVRARQLAAEVRRLREAAMMTGEDVAGQLGWSPSKISRIETGRTAVTGSDLQRLLDLYQVSGAQRDRLAELGRTATQRGWWDAYSDTLQAGYSTLLALETGAESERYYMPSLVHGLLQTEAYAQEIIHSGLLVAPPGEVKRRVQVRVTRQLVLTKDDPLELIGVLDEAVLRRQVGGPAVMREQLLHLVEMADRSNVNLQVLPFSAGSHPAMSGGFTILRFPEVIASDVVYVENMTSDLFVESETEVYHYGLAFARLRELALEERQSLNLISQIANEIK